MSRPFPISERVSQHVADTLKRVSPATGFNTAFRVERWRKRGNDPEDLLLVVCEGAERKAADEDTEAGHTARWRLYELVIYVFEAESSDVPYEQRCNVAAADAERAVMADPTRGGLARNTEMRDPAVFEDVNAATGVVVRFECLYAHLEGDPYSRHGE